MRKYLKYLRICLVPLLVFIASHTAYSQDYHFLSQWGDNRPDMSLQLSKPRGVAVDGATGNVYVTDVYKGLLYKYDSNGRMLWTVNDCKGVPFNYPMEITIDLYNNNLYLPDYLNGRICVLDLQGNDLKTIAGFNAPLGAALDYNLNLYVTDRYSNVVKKFNSSGNLLATWPGFNSLWGITYWQGYVYVTDNYMVKKLALDGTPVKQWGLKGTGNGQFYMTEGIVAYNGLIYVADGEYGRVQVFDLAGNFKKMISERGTGNGQLQFSTALAIDGARNRLYVSDDDDDRIMVFDLNGNYVKQWGCDSTGTTGLRYPTKIAVDDNNGVMYVVDSGSHRIIKMDLPSMTVLKTWGSYGSGNGQFRYPFDAAVDSVGDVYVLDSTARNIQKFDPEGNYLSKLDFNSAPLLTDTLIYKYGMQGIAFDSADNMYVVDVDTQKLYKISPTGNKLAGWNINNYSTGVAIDEANGYIYVTTFSPDSIIQYNMNGVPTGKKIGPVLPGSSVTMNHPYDVKVVENGNLLVPDTFRSRVLKLDNDGNLLATLGSTNPSDLKGSNMPGKFAFPYGVGADKDGYVYVADTNNHRIQVFEPQVFIATSSLQSVILGGAYSQTLEATGIDPPFVWSLQSGSLPTGLTLNAATGLISGTPTALGVYSFTIKVTDAGNSTFTRDFTMTVTYPIMIPGGTPPYYSSLNGTTGAFTAATDGNTIKCRATTLNESPVLSRSGLSLVLKGGYDATFSNNPGTTTIKGGLTITQGTLTVERLILQ